MTIEEMQRANDALAREITGLRQSLLSCSALLHNAVERAEEAEAMLSLATKETL